MNARLASEKLAALASPADAQTALRFFKCAPGQYGEGDLFIGVKAQPLRKTAREFLDLPLPEIKKLLLSKIHEERALALLILVGQFAKASPNDKKAIYEFYLAHLAGINNWDLVDVSAPSIVGGYLKTQSRKPLTTMARSSNLWERRIAIVATQHFIRNNEFADTLTISRLLLDDQEDLIHKATGWMLREVGDRDLAPLEAFLADNGPRMPRTMLRYAIEKFPETKRQGYLKAFPPVRVKNNKKA